MKIRSASFLTAAESIKDYPPGGFCEVAFAGRSNVGKSSAINVLLGRHNLVRTSKTPGHTQKLNFFLINEEFIFVDFPGYGFAKVPLEVKKKWRPMVEDYLNTRRELAGIVLIIDSRHLLTASDGEMTEYLIAKRIPLVLAATKADKLTHSEKLAQFKKIKTIVGDKVPVVLLSSLNGLGKNELWKEIKNLIEMKRSRGAGD